MGDFFVKFKRSAAIIAALAMATTGALFMSQQDAKATTVAHTTTASYANLYTIDGKRVKNRALAHNTDWLVGKTMSLWGTEYYQVATNEWLRANDSYLTGDLANRDHDSQLYGNVTVGGAKIYRDDTNTWTNKVLPTGGVWPLLSYVVNKDNQEYMQISKHEYVSGKNMILLRNGVKATYIANFGLDKTDNSATNTNNNPNTNTNTSNNSDNNQTTSDYKPNISQINTYFVKYLNALHAANGTAPVQTTSDMINYAAERAGQQDGQNLDHTTAARSTSENLSSAGFNYMKYAGVHSDRDAAYFLLKDWYDENNNYSAPGTAGHYGHRAALIYSGPNVGLGITNNDAAFDADWNYSTLDAQNELFNYTGSNPNTKFISKDAVK